MRNFMSIIAEAIKPDERLMQALAQLNAYINENTPVDHRAIAATLREYGYNEDDTDLNTNTFYRAMYHEIPPNSPGTIGDFYKKVSDGSLLDMSRPMATCGSLEEVNEFLHGSVYNSGDGETWPSHREDTPLADLHQVWIIYEIASDKRNILWSMDGLRCLAMDYEELYRPIVKMLAEYGSDNEVMLDPKGGRVISTILYDSTEHEEQFDD